MQFIIQGRKLTLIAARRGRRMPRLMTPGVWEKDLHRCMREGIKKGLSHTAAPSFSCFLLMAEQEFLRPRQQIPRSAE